MSAFERLPRLFRWPWRSRAQILDEIDEEIAFHLEMRAERLQRSGLSAEAARAQALREFGDQEALRRALRLEDEAAERRRARRSWWADLAQDVRLGARRLRGSPGFTALGVGTLAVQDAALYQALRRLEGRGLVTAEWGLSESRRRARFYTLTEAGRAHLRAESAAWRRYVDAVFQVLEPLPGEAP